MHRKQPRLVDFLEHAHLRDVGVPMLFGAVVLFASAVAMLSANVSALRQSNKDVERSNNALLGIAETNTLLMGIDMSVRGYALTDKPDFVRYEIDNHKRLDQEIDKLAYLTRDDAVQSANIAKLRLFVAKQEAIFSQLLNLGPGHAREVAAAIADPAKRQVRYTAQNILTTLHNGEMRRLSTRKQTVERQIVRSFYIALGVVMLAFVAGVLGAGLTLFGLRKSQPE